MIKFNLSQPGMCIKGSADPFIPEIIFEHVINETTYYGILNKRDEIKLLGDLCRKINYHASEPLDIRHKQRIAEIIADEKGDPEVKKLLAELSVAYTNAINPPKNEMNEYPQSVFSLIKHLIQQVEICDYQDNNIHPLKNNVAYVNLKKFFDSVVEPAEV